MKYHNSQIRCIFVFIIVFLMVLSLVSCKKNTEVNDLSSETTVSDNNINGDEITEDNKNSDEALTSKNATTSEENSDSSSSVTTEHTHSYTSQVIAATCASKGYTSYKCSCGKTYKDNFINALGHSYGEWVTVVLASEEKRGLREKKCIRCEDTESETLPATYSSMPSFEEWISKWEQPQLDYAESNGLDLKESYDKSVAANTCSYCGGKDGPYHHSIGDRTCTNCNKFVPAKTCHYCN